MMTDQEIHTLKNLGCVAVYVACPIHGQEEEFAFRNAVVAEIKKWPKIFVLPFFSDLPEDTRENINVFDFDMARVSLADVVCVVRSRGSDGVGMELRQALIDETPVLLFTSAPKDLSRITRDYLKSRGLPAPLQWTPNERNAGEAAALIAQRVAQWMGVDPDLHYREYDSWRQDHPRPTLEQAFDIRSR